VIFGAALFGLMAIVAFLPFGPFGGNDDDQIVPTSSANVSSILGTSTPSTASAQATEGAGSAPPPDNERVVCIDAGHGGWDTGFVRSTSEDPPYSSPTFNEAELNLGMAMMLRDELEENGITVVMTRVTGGAVNIFDQDINEDGQTRVNVAEEGPAEQAGDRDELQARINICNEANADVLISVHLNGFDDRTVRGYEVIYTAAPAREDGAQNERLARAVYRRLDSAMRESSYGGGLGRDAVPDTEVDSVQHEFGTEEHYIMTGPGVNNAEYTITPSEMPGIIVEGLFISNDQDAAFVADPANQRLMVDAYAQGIIDYFEQFPG
jgi:N-acetylmuramoyl-L-alanine amidase